jgi:serine/threonine protein kinase
MGTSSPAETIRTIGKYILVEKLGEGYLGTVFRALDEDRGCAVAIRILCEGIKWDEKIEEQFHRECQAIAGLKHPNIAAIVDVGVDGQSRYIAMESLGNRNLLNLIAQKSDLSFEAKLSVMIQISDGLSFAHNKGILHLDLNPEKIHLAADGSVKIRDFAVAHVLMKHLPHPPVRWGVPIYLSPEQIQHKSCDARSDVFSAGTVFYELLTGLHPFHDPNGNVALDNVLLDAQIPTFERFPNAPPEIWGVLKTCLARDPQDRYQSTAAMAAACRELAASVAEDTQLMLAELYASMTPLRRAAAQLNAPEGVIRLFEEIQLLSNGEKEADYASLDRLMTALIEHSSSIRSAAESAIPVDLQIPATSKKAARRGPGAACSGEAKAKIKTEIQKPPADAPPAKSVENAGTGNTTENPQTTHTDNENPPREPENHFANSSIGQNAEMPADAIENDPGTLPRNPDQEFPSIDAELPAVNKIPTATRYRRIPRPSYRTAVILLSILVIAVAGYIVWNTEAAPIRNAWGLLMTHLPGR